MCLLDFKTQIPYQACSILITSAALVQHVQELRICSFSPKLAFCCSSSDEQEYMARAVGEKEASRFRPLSTQWFYLTLNNLAARMYVIPLFFAFKEKIFDGFDVPF